MKIPIERTTEIILEKRGKLAIRPSEYIATGGEGVIYRAKNTIIKLYTDQDKMIRHNFAEKLQLLSSIRHPSIIAPQGIVTTLNGKPVGFYMSFVHGEPFPRVFTNDFRNRTGFDDNDASRVVACMQDVVRVAHTHNALIVDANEFNWIATDIGEKDGPIPKILDVDSWAIDRWPATAIMPSIKDWHTNGFNEFTDWFAWGIVSFQLYAGIHPYKGRLDGFEVNDIEERMKKNASVFRNGVRLNRAVREFSSIPGPLFDWYVETFEHGKRFIPPSPYATGIAVTSAGLIARVIITADGSLAYTKLLGNGSDKAIHIYPCGIVLLKSGYLINLANKKRIATVRSNACEIIQVEGGWIKAEKINGVFSFSHIKESTSYETPLAFNVKSDTLIRYENRLFVITDGGLTEIKCTLFGKPMLSTGHTWGAMINSTHWFEGVGIQDAMGAMYLIAPFDDNACAYVRTRELDGFVPVHAKAGHRFVVVIAADANGEYHKFEFSFSRDYTHYSMWHNKTDDSNFNIAILPKGICATVTKDGELTIFVPSSGTSNRIADKGITTDFTLSNWENNVVYINNGDVWHVQMK